MRKAVVVSFIAAIVGFHLLALALDSDFWVFSTYPMYSAIENRDLPEATPAFSREYPRGSSKELAYFSVAAVDANGKEFDLFANARFGSMYLAPLNKAQVVRPFLRVFKAQDQSLEEKQQRLEHMLAECVTQYSALRSLRIHRGPPLRAMRLYWVWWADIGGRVPGTGELSPDRRVLIAEAGKAPDQASPREKRPGRER